MITETTLDEHHWFHAVIGILSSAPIVSLRSAWSH